MAAVYEGRSARGRWGSPEFFNLCRHTFNQILLFLVHATLFMVVGIWLTGFDQVHWFMYVLPAIFTVSATFGICPGINLWRMVLGEDK